MTQSKKLRPTQPPKTQKPKSCGVCKIGSTPPAGRLNDDAMNNLRWRPSLHFATGGIPAKFPPPFNNHEFQKRK